MKIGRLFIFGVGYVLGTKAGRERYNQLVQLAQTGKVRLDAYISRQQAETPLDEDTSSLFEEERF